MEKFDVVIIGSGLGGLECGLILSKEGYKVCVLEKNRQLGGNLQIFYRDKAIFDTGIHYIGGLEKGQNLYQYFKYFGLMDKLKLKKLDEDHFDIITFDGDPVEYKYAQGYDNFIETLVKLFPNEREGLVKYCDKMKEVCDNFPLYRLKEADPAQAMSTEFIDVSAKEFIESVTSDIKLQNVLAGSNPLYAGIADKTPLYVHALVVNTYIESSWKCIDGGAQISSLLAKSIKENGGVIRNYSEAKKLIFEEDVLKYVELEDSTRIEGNYFISNAHPAKTMEMLEPGKVRKAYLNRIKTLENTISVFILNIVFKKDTFNYLNYNYYHYRSNDVWEGVNYDVKDWPSGYAVFTPATSKSEEYADCMIVMSYMFYDEVKKWENSHNTIPKKVENRGDDYEEFKRIKSEKLLDELEKKFPGIRDNIASYYSSTPLSFRDYIGNDDGSLYGIVKDYKDPLKSFISSRTKVPNLFLTGQNLNMHGVLGVTISAVKTCGDILGLNYLLKKINEA